MLLRKMLRFMPHVILLSLLAISGQMLWVLGFKKMEDVLSHQLSREGVIAAFVMAGMLLAGALISEIATYFSTYVKTAIIKYLSPMVLMSVVKSGRGLPGEMASVSVSDVYEFVSVINADASWGLVYFVRIFFILFAMWTLSAKVAIAGSVYVIFTMLYLVWETAWYTKKDYEIDDERRKKKEYLADTLDGKEDIHLLGRVEKERLSIRRAVYSLFDKYKRLLILDFFIGTLVSHVAYLVFAVYSIYVGISDMSIPALGTLFVYVVMLGQVVPEIYGVIDTLREAFNAGKKIDRVLRGGS